MYFASIFTEMELPADEPMQDNPCPTPSCVDLFRKSGQTPCMKFCPVQCLSGDIDEDGNQAEMRYDMASCAEMTQQFESVPGVLADAIRAETEEEREDMLFDAENKILWYKLSVGSGGLLGQCFECMRVCPIANQSSMADPIRRYETRMAAEAGDDA